MSQQYATQTSKSLNVKKIAGEVAAQKESAFKRIQKMTATPPTSVVTPTACVLCPPLDLFTLEMRQINELGDITLKRVVDNHKTVTLYKTRTEIVEGLRGLSPLYVNRQVNNMYKGGWVSLKIINLNGFEYSDVFPEKITDVEMNPEKSAIRATYGQKGYVAQIRYYGEYVPYCGPYTVFCFTHTSMRGLGEINSKRRYNILRTPERTKSAGVVAYVDLKTNPEMELWSRVGDRWQNEVCCLDTKISNFITNIVYDENYMDNIESNHNSEIVYLQEKWGVAPEIAAERVKSLMFSCDASDYGSVDAPSAEMSEEMSDDEFLALEMEAIGL